MIKISTSLLLMSLANLSYGQQKNVTLIDTDKEFAALSYKKGISHAFESFLDDDAIFLSSSPLPIEGKKNFMKLFADTKSTVIWQPTGSFEDQSGKSGFTYGLSKWNYHVADSLVSSYYIYNTNWKKNKYNDWKVTTDIGTEISLKKYSQIPKNNFKTSKIVIPKITKVIKKPEYHIITFSFDSDRKGKVPAIIVKPIGKKIRGLVCYQHGIGKDYNKEYFLEEARKLANNGIASLMIDAPFKRTGDSYIENGGINDSVILENNCVEWLQAIKGIEKFDLNISNFIFVGQSYGARVAALMPYLDSRFKKILVIGGIFNYSEWLQTTMVQDIIELRKRISSQDLKLYIDSVGRFDASIYLNKKNDINFFFQAGKEDETLSEYDILSCYEMINSKKSIIWYNNLHDMNSAAINDRIQKILYWSNE